LGSNLRTVVSGTGKLVRMLSNATGISQHSDELLDYDGGGLIAPMARTPGSMLRGSSGSANGNTAATHGSSSLANDCLVTMMAPAHSVSSGGSSSALLSSTVRSPLGTTTDALIDAHSIMALPARAQEQPCCGTRYAVLVMVSMLSILYVVWQFVL